MGCGPDKTSGRGGLACMCSLLATFVQASQKPPLMWNACDAETRVAVEHHARAAQLDGISTGLQLVSALRQGVAALRKYVCTKMQTPRGVALFGEFFDIELTTNGVGDLSSDTPTFPLPWTIFKQ